VTWSGDDEHSALLAAAAKLLDNLEGLESRFVVGDVQHLIHNEFARRTRLLGNQLRAAMSLVRQDLYPAAFGLLRSAMEQVYVDLLMFMGRRFHQRYLRVSDELWEKWNADREAGEAWTADIVSWERTPRNGNVLIVREGLRSSNDDAVLSIFYFLLDQYSPWMGPPEIQTLFDDGFGDVDSQVRAAQENRAMYRQYLSWGGVKANLSANNLASEEDVRMLEVHYRFLSAFVHPIAHVTDCVYGRNSPWPRYDHFASELALLYVNVFASLELASFLRMSQERPVLELSDWAEVETSLNVSVGLTEHLWWPGGHPHAYDRWQAGNKLAFRAFHNGEELTGGRPGPEELRDSEVPYYANPIVRLVEMHRSARELTTGFAYLSPWEREDARWR
jgi:hypothetical protein